MLNKEEELEISVARITEGTEVVYEIKNFDLVKELALKKMDEYKTHIIENDEDNKEAKEFRANCNKAKKNISNLRLTTIKSIVGKFESQAKELEKIFDNKQEEIGEKIDAYVSSKKETKTLVGNKTNTYSLKLTYTNKDLTQQIIDFCTTNNITVEEI